MCEKLKKIQEQVKDAALRTGRDPEKIKIVAVSKKKPVSDIERLYNCGQKIFGENYVQEAVQKIEQLSGLEDISWHFIGHLQRNKAKIAVSYFDWIEGVDSLRLAKAINKHAKNLNKKIKCLLQINIGKEETKSGFFEEELDEILEEFPKFSALELKGFMTIHPRSNLAEDARIWFKKMKKLLNKYQERYPNLSLNELSMGMSKDFEIAIEEGATIVRIGTAVFGPRI